MSRLLRRGHCLSKCCKVCNLLLPFGIKRKPPMAKSFVFLAFFCKRKFLKQSSESACGGEVHYRLIKYQYQIKVLLHFCLWFFDFASATARDSNVSWILQKKSFFDAMERFDMRRATVLLKTLTVWRCTFYVLVAFRGILYTIHASKAEIDISDKFRALRR